MNGSGWEWRLEGWLFPLRVYGTLGSPSFFTESDQVLLDSIKSNPTYDFRTYLNQIHQNDPLANPYIDTNIISDFYDQFSFIEEFQNSKNPIFLNLNAQSLPSKHCKIASLLNEFSQNKVNIDILALQEIWQIPSPDFIQIPGYQFIYKTRAFSKGGGIGFFIKDSIDFKIVENLSPFFEKNFESLTIEITINNKKTLLTTIYRPPTQTAESLLTFSGRIDSLLRDISATNYQSFIFLDANINLLNLTNQNGAIDYLDSLLNNGFIQTIMKATRFHNQSYSLIDHILTNSSHNLSSGTIISDISDHFLTFISAKNISKQKTPNVVESRSISSQQISNFKNSLGSLSWETTLLENNVNSSYANFSNDFFPLFDLHFPKTKKKFNKNFNKINDFMTIGLLTSRRTKNELHKKYIQNPTVQNFDRYKKFRNIFNTLLRKSKILYYETNLNLHSRDPRKTWDILREIIGKKNHTPISELSINGEKTSDPLKMANEFNNFYWFKNL